MAAFQFLAQRVKTSHVRNKHNFGTDVCLQGDDPLETGAIGFGHSWLAHNYS